MRATHTMTQQPGGPARSRHTHTPRVKTANTGSPDHARDATYLLQRYLGNSALQSMAEDGHTRSDVPTLQRACACGGTCASCAEQDHEIEQIHPKLIIGQPGDIYEREADQVAETVMRLPEPQTSQEVATPGEVQGLRTQHQPTEGSDEVRLQPLEEEEEKEEEILPLQAKAISAISLAVPPDLISRIHVLRGGGKPLPATPRAFFEPRFGYDFSPVRIHTDARAAEAARAVQARAFTVGRDVVFGAGQYAPGTTEGRRLLAHELTHTLQQSSGSELSIQRAPAPGSHGNVGGCQLENLSEEDSGTLAHHQVVTHSELVKQMGRQVPGRWIPRASKDVKKDCPTTSEAGPGASDLFFYGRPWVFMAEIKSINQPDLAVQEYQHYAKRIIELVARFHNDGSVCSDYVQNGANGADVDFDERHLNGDIRFSVDYGLDAEGAGVRPAPVTDAMVPSRPVDAGVFPDPRIIRSTVARTKRLFYENQNNGGVVYWCNTTEEDKDKDEKSREEPEPSDTSGELQQEGSTLDYALNCVVEGVLGEIVHDPSMCGILLDSALSLIPYVDQAADIRDTLAHLYWILYRGEYDNPSRWVAVAFTLVGYLPEAGSAIKSTSKIGEKAIREGLQKIDDFAGPQLRKIFAAENLDAVLESIMKQQSKWKADGIELFNKGLDELEYRLEQALSAAALLARMTGFGAEAIVKLIRDEIARIQKLMADAPEMLNEAFDEVFARITRTIEALKREPVDIHPPTSAAPVKAPATPSTSAPRRPVGAAQQELFERH
jgi:hypothetical protein